MNHKQGLRRRAREIPFAEASERWIAAAITQRPEWWPVVSGILDTDDFFTELLKCVYAAELAENRALDAVALIDAIPREYVAEVSSLADAPIHLDIAELQRHVNLLLEARRD